MFKLQDVVTTPKSGKGRGDSYADSIDSHVQTREHFGFTTLGQTRVAANFAT